MSEVLVIGSGFGGAISAFRFAGAGHRVTILELGEDWRPAGKAQQSQDPRFLFRLMRNYPVDPLRTHPKVIVTLGMGYGGGSLVYSGIHLRAPEQAFAGWPAGWNRAALDPFYARVEERLGVAPMTDAFDFGRPAALAAGAAAAGLPPPQPMPLAMRGCTRCGWCVPICAWGKKQTMQHTYLAAAEATGRLRVITHRKAAFVETAGDRYRVSAWRTDGVDKNYHAVNSGPLDAYVADKVVIAGGAIESPALLARSAPHLRPLPIAHVGAGLDGTGDFVQGGFVPQRVQAFKGAVMMTYIDRGDFVLEDIHGIPVGTAVTLDARLPGIEKSWGKKYKHSFRGYGEHMLGIAIVGAQAPGTERSITVHDDKGNAVVGGTAYGPAPGALDAARAIITAQGGELARTPWELSGSVFTVHPTGGCAMGQVLRPDTLEVIGNPGLHVIDGSALPANPLRNPSHTIAAVAERALDALLP